MICVGCGDKLDMECRDMVITRGKHAGMKIKTLRVSEMDGMLAVIVVCGHCEAVHCFTTKVVDEVVSFAF